MIILTIAMVHAAEGQSHATLHTTKMKVMTRTRGRSHIATLNHDHNTDDSDGACYGRPEPCHSTYDEDEGDEKDEREAKEGQKRGGWR